MKVKVLGRGGGEGSLIVEMDADVVRCLLLQNYPIPGEATLKPACIAGPTLNERIKRYQGALEELQSI